MVPGKPLWCFIKDVVFPGNLRHSHRRCPVCLETKFVPRPPQPSGGSFSEQPFPCRSCYPGWVYKDGGAFVGAGPIRPTEILEGSSGLGEPSPLAFSFFLLGGWRRRNLRCVLFSFC